MTIDGLARSIPQRAGARVRELGEWLGTELTQTRRGECMLAVEVRRDGEAAAGAEAVQRMLKNCQPSCGRVPEVLMPDENPIPRWQLVQPIQLGSIADVKLEVLARRSGRQPAAAGLIDGTWPEIMAKEETSCTLRGELFDQNSSLIGSATGQIHHPGRLRRGPPSHLQSQIEQLPQCPQITASMREAKRDHRPHACRRPQAIHHVQAEKDFSDLGTHLSLRKIVDGLCRGGVFSFTLFFLNEKNSMKNTKPLRQKFVVLALGLLTVTSLKAALTITISSDRGGFATIEFEGIGSAVTNDGSAEFMNFVNPAATISDDTFIVGNIPGAYNDETSTPTITLGSAQFTRVFATNQSSPGSLGSRLGFQASSGSVGTGDALSDLDGRYDTTIPFSIFAPGTYQLELGFSQDQRSVSDVGPISLTVVPEPSAGFLFGAAAAFFMMHRSRTGRRS